MRRLVRPTRLVGAVSILAGAAAAVAAAAACGLGFGPGDYGGAVGDAAAIGSDAPPLDGPITTLPDGAVPGTGKHLLVVAGEKDHPTDQSASDAWVASIDTNGNVGAFTSVQSTFFRGTLSVATVTGGRLRIAARGTTGRVVEWIDFDNATGIIGNWRGAIVEQPFLPGWGQIFSGSSILALGGAGNVPQDGGGNAFQRADSIFISPFLGDDAGYGPLTTSTTKLPLPIQAVIVVAYKEFIYIFGGESGLPDQASKVYVARIDPDPNIGVGAFVETTRVVNPQSGQPHAPSGPMICGAEGRMFMAGGNGNDIVLTASINEADGTLGAWKAAPKLPGPLRSAGCAVWNGALHLIGGIGATSRSDRIIRAPIAADGTLGEWDLSAGSELNKLPAPRSSIVALVY